MPIVEAILSAGADPNEREIFSNSALVVSLTRDYGNPSVTLLLLRAGARVPNTCDDQDSLLSLETQGSGDPAVMRSLIAKGVPVNCRGGGESALYWAALNGQADTVALLLELGADPREREKDGKTLIDVATVTNPEPRVQAEFARTRELLSRRIREMSK